ncbi:MAG: hypothetical protein ACYDG2_22615 [Ruminiclostridium sp.]
MTLVIAILILGITKIILASASNEMAISVQRAEKITELQILYSDESDANSKLANLEVIKKVKALDSVKHICQ